jgi:hypothetical protein
MLISKFYILEIPREQVWESYGAFLIEYTMEIGWDELLRTISPSLKVVERGQIIMGQLYLGLFGQS